MPHTQSTVEIEPDEFFVLFILIDYCLFRERKRERDQPTSSFMQRVRIYEAAFSGLSCRFCSVD